MATIQGRVPNSAGVSTRLIRPTCLHDEKVAHLDMNVAIFVWRGFCSCRVMNRGWEGGSFDDGSSSTFVYIMCSWMKIYLVRLGELEGILKFADLLSENSIIGKRMDGSIIQNSVK